jgi:hypothetical protein
MHSLGRRATTCSGRHRAVPRSTVLLNVVSRPKVRRASLTAQYEHATRKNFRPANTQGGAGLTQLSASSHPTLELMKARLAEGSLPGKRADGYKLGLVVEVRACMHAHACKCMHCMRAGSRACKPCYLAR